MELLDALKWRYATKKYDPTKRVSEEMVKQLLEVAHLAPTSSGLQPFKVVVISNQAIKESLVPHSMNQQQIADCSHLLVFAAWDRYTAERIDGIFKKTTAERNLPETAMTEYGNRIKDLYLNQTAEENFVHTAKQTYIAFGMVLAAAAELKIDTTPMEGFDTAAYDKILNLNEQGLKSVTVVPLGYRDAGNDWLVNLKKVRHAKDDFIIEMK
ncbi:NAD(P)H-dependent oxidoreductase [Flavobacterium sp. JP2137]|uniref:NAD(P)H-dependent oxidoreductase n=1 Tax=Flavobacterium sp. JP2137 TaxID=3414510 RepID=UPI003D2FA188